VTDLATKVKRGTSWSLLNTSVVRLGTFLSGIVFARLLSPSDYGIYAAGLVALMVLLSMNELGVSLAIVRWEGDVRRFAPTVLTLAVMSSVLLYGVLFVVAPWLAGALGSPDAAAVLRLLCVCVVIDSLTCVSAGLVTREFAQGKRFVVDVASFLVGTLVTLVLAVQGVGAWSLAWGAVAGNLVALVGFTAVAPYHIWPGWDAAVARDLVRFGLPLAGSSLLVLAMLNVDYVIVGAALGPIALGLYLLAFNISSWPVKSVSEAVRRVSFAGFSRLASSHGARGDAFVRGIALLMAAAVPACVLLATLAEPLIRITYGERWVPAAEALRFLAVLGLLRVACELVYDYLVAMNRSRMLLLAQGWWLFALVPVLIVAAHAGGIAAVGLGHVIVAAVLVVPVFLRALAHEGVAVRAVGRACARPFVGGVVMTVVSLGALHIAGAGVAGLLLAGALAVGVYAPIVLPMRVLLHADREPAWSA
jgi:O-antigen/teichoic acid export membrane protein